MQNADVYYDYMDILFDTKKTILINEPFWQSILFIAKTFNIAETGFFFYVKKITTYFLNHLKFMFYVDIVPILLFNNKFKRYLNRTATQKFRLKYFLFSTSPHIDDIKNIKFSINPIADASCIYLLLEKLLFYYNE